MLYNAEIRFALLTACESASVAGSSLFNGLAPGLIMAGVPAVIGMQYRISDDFASSFAIKFYSALLQRKDVVEALTVARAMLLRSAWYSPALDLRQHRAADEHLKATYETRNIDTAAPAEAQASKPFLVRLWIRRPETQPLTEEQLRAELGVPDRVAVSTRAERGRRQVRASWRSQAAARRGDHPVDFARMRCRACQHQAVCGRTFGCAARDLHGQGDQTGARGADLQRVAGWRPDCLISHLVQVVDAAKQPRAGIRAGSSAIPMQTPAPPWGVPWSPRPGAEAVGPLFQVRRCFPLAPTAVTVGTPARCGRSFTRVQRRGMICGGGSVWWPCYGSSPESPPRCQSSPHSDSVRPWVPHYCHRASSPRRVTEHLVRPGMADPDVSPSSLCRSWPHPFTGEIGRAIALDVGYLRRSW